MKIIFAHEQGAFKRDFIPSELPASDRRVNLCH